MMMTNSIGGSGVRRETLKGREWLVAPVTLIKSMELDKGYVPENQVTNSVRAWNGTPLTLNHPRDASGDLVSANSPTIAEKTWLGHVFNSEARVDDTAYVDGEAWFDIEHCRNLGEQAEQIIEDLEAGKTVSVSSSYFGDPMPAGNYDGEHRDEVKGNLKPDHIAVLPNKTGVCSVQDGCGVGEIAANEMMITNALTQARRPEFSGTETSSFSDVSKGLRLIVEGLGLDPDLPDDADEVRVSHLNDEERQAIANLSLLGDPEADNLDDLRLFQVVNHNNGNLNENALRAVLGGPGQRAEISDDAWRSAANVAVDLLESEFDVDVDTDQIANAIADIDREPPQAARDNAQMALDAREETGNPNDCGREAGWRRANQLVSNDEMSWDAISRMAQFSRHESNKEQGDEGRENCGWMMWKAWGGDEGVDWAQRKMDEREQAANTDDSGNSDEVTDESFKQKFMALGRSVGLIGEEQTVNESAESDTETTMSERTQELVTNHGFDEDNLPPEDTECFERIYNAVTEDDDNVEFESEEAFEQAVNERVSDAVDERVEEVLDERVDEVLANSQEEQEKSDLADEIIGNSSDWDEDDREELMDSPTSVLKDLAGNQQNSQPADHRGQIGASANAAPADSNSMPSLSATNRMNEGGD